MCGIAGIVGRIDDRNRNALAEMGKAMRHRGPDGENAWISPADEEGFGCLFLHRRLAILDLTTFASQPMVDPTANQVIVFNGEIYNYQQLRQELVGLGQQFQSTGDTAVMLRALALFGPAAVRKLRGMFAFGLWDPDARKLTLGRDPLGIKPLYVTHNPDPQGPWKMAFASEVRALLASGLIQSPSLDPRAVASIVWNGFVAGPGTILSGVEQLLPGQTVVYDRMGAVLSREFSWQMPPAGADAPANATDLSAALAESVREHLASDVPLGVFLSGGIDSSVMANLAKQANLGPVDTFTLTLNEGEYDEGPIAAEIAKMIGTRHHEFRLTEAQFMADLDTALNSLDQPSFDGINSYYISRAVREAGVTVALSGAGGDELFGGYESFRQLPRLRKIGESLAWAPDFVRQTGASLVDLFAGRARGPVKPQTRWAKLPDMIRRGDDLLGLYQMVYSLFRPDFQRELLNDPNDALPDGLSERMRNWLAPQIAGRSTLSAISVLEQRMFQGERLLRDTDAASMAVSLETRLPLVDRVITETVMRLPDSVRYTPGRPKQALLAAGLKGLDLSIFNRPKSGFVLPFNTWIRRGLSRTMADTMLSPELCRNAGLNPASVQRLWNGFQQGQPGLYWSRIWAIYSLLRWSQKWNITIATTPRPQRLAA